MYEELQEMAKPFWDTMTDLDSLDTARAFWRMHLTEDAFLPLSLGHVLLDFDPHRPGVEKLVAKKAKEVATEARRHSHTPQTVGRAFYQEWLTSISLFEKSELARKEGEIRNDNLFYRYRQVIAPWQWPS